MRFLQILEGESAKTAVVVVVTRDQSVIDAAIRTLSQRLQGSLWSSAPGRSTGPDTNAIDDSVNIHQAPEAGD